MIKSDPLLTYNCYNNLGVWHHSEDICIYCDCFDIKYHYLIVDFSYEKKGCKFCQCVCKTLNEVKEYLNDKS